MAIEKKITTKSGYEAKYWRIGVVTLNRQEGTVFLKMDAYKDSEKRAEDIYAIADSKVYNFSVDELGDGSIVEEAYLYIKELSEFEGALDI